jgi:hypothetical protein
MRDLGTTALFAFAALAGAVTVKLGLDAYRERNPTLQAQPATAAAKEEAIRKAESSIAQVKEDATRKRPDLPVSEALRQEAVERAGQTLEAEGDARKRRMIAASNFMGFYLVNTRERAGLCREQGVDIAQFVSAFERDHVAELGFARTALKDSPVGEEELHSMLKTQLRDMVRQDMQDVASAAKTSLKGACELVAENGTSVASEIHFSKAQPAAHRVLTGGR